MSLGLFGQMWKEALRASDPAGSADLERDGTLEMLAEAADQRGELMYQEVLVNLQKSNPLPKPYHERVQALKVLANQARELVLDEILPRGPEDQSAEGHGYVDLATPTASSSPDRLTLSEIEQLRRVQRE